MLAAYNNCYETREVAIQRVARVPSQQRLRELGDPDRKIVGDTQGWGLALDSVGIEVKHYQMESGEGSPALSAQAENDDARRFGG
jgi:hypothetical protein